MNQYPAIYLASRSPRRRELLQQIDVSFEVLDNIDIDEQPFVGESCIALVQRLAIEKALAGWHSPQRTINKPVLGADTLLELDGEPLGKPTDFAHFQSMMRQLSGRAHHVLSAIALVQDQKQQLALNCSEVQFRALSDAEIADYWQTGEPHDKAGGYAIQGFATIFVQQIKGSYTGIVGLPLFETAQLLQQYIRQE